MGLWHYEHVPGRTNNREWRIADDSDDVIADFPSEEEACNCVRKHNAAWIKAHSGWKYK